MYEKLVDVSFAQFFFPKTSVTGMWKQWNRNTLSYYSKEKDTGTDKKSLWVGVLRLRAGGRNMKKEREGE